MDFLKTGSLSRSSGVLRTRRRTSIFAELLPRAAVVFLVIVALGEAAAQTQSPGVSPSHGPTNAQPSGYFGPNAGALPAAPATLARVLEQSAAETVQGGIGAWDVTPAGSFSYTIPIELPAGRRDMQPDLKIIYDSSVGNGLLGAGFRLIGIPVIERFDAGTGIHFDAGDSFAFNSAGWDVPVDAGQMFVRVPATRSLAGDSFEYRTATESWNRFTSFGTCGTGPCYWTMDDGAGRTYFFGGTAQSNPGMGSNEAVDWERDAGEGSRGIARWHLKIVRDLEGNYYEVQHTRYGGILHATSIEYAKWPTGGVQTHVVTLRYENRPDAFRFGASKRLEAIEIRSAGQGVRRYLLEYEPSPASGRSRLDTVQEQGSDFETAPQPAKLPPHRFDWNDDGPARGELGLLANFSSAGTTPTQWHVSPEGVIRTYHGLITPSGPNEQVISAASGVSPGSPGWISSTIPWDFVTTNTYDRWTSHLADFDGDGNHEIAMVHTDWEGIAVRYYRAGTMVDWDLVPFATPTRAASNDPEWLAAINGNGEYPNYWQSLVADINGDGADDLIFLQPCGRNLLYALAAPDGTGYNGTLLQELKQVTGAAWGSAIARCVAGQPAGVRIADINGDHRSDVVIGYAPDTGLAVTVALGTASGLSPVRTVELSYSVNEEWHNEDRRVPQLVVGDINGDGRSDAAFAYHGNRGHLYAVALGRSKNAGLGLISIIADDESNPLPTRTHESDGSENCGPCPETRGWDHHLLDVSADGLADLVSTYRGQEGRRTFISRGLSSGGLSAPLASADDHATDLPDPANSTDPDVSARPSDGYSDPWRTLLADTNGDGLPELVSVYAGGLGRYSATLLGDRSTDITIAKNLSNTLAPFSPLPVPLTSAMEWHTTFPTRYALSISGDDKLDFVLTGHTPTEVHRADFNGDGADEIVIVGNNRAAVAWSTGGAPDILRAVQNPLGGIVTVNYQAARHTTSAITGDSTCTESSVPNAACGFSTRAHRWLVSQVETANGRGFVETFQFSFANGRHTKSATGQVVNLGFAEINRKNVNSGARVQTRFYQIPPYQQYPKEVKTFDGTNSISSVTSYEYDVAPNSPPGISFVRLRSTFTTNYESGNTAVNNRKISLEYDELGQISIETDCADWECRRESSKYEHNTFLWLRARLASNGTESGRIDDTQPTARAYEGSISAWTVLGWNRLVFDLSGVIEQAQQVIDHLALLCVGPTCVCDSQGSCSGGRWVPVEHSMRYDEFGNLKLKKDARGLLTEHSYDPSYRAELASSSRVSRSAAGSITLVQRQTYDFAGRLESSTDPALGVTFWRYDKLGRLLRIERPDQGRDDYRYVADGDPNLQYFEIVTTFVESGATREGTYIRRFFDGFGHQYRSEQAGEGCASIIQERTEEYRLGRRVVSLSVPRYSTEPLVVHEATYDARSRLLRLERVAGADRRALIRNEYGAFTLLSRDAKNRVSLWSVDARGRTTRRTDTAGREIQYRYDLADRLVEVILPGGVTNTWRYNTLGRLTSSLDPDRSSTSFEYDDAGNLVEEWTTAGHVVRTFDDLNRIRTETDGTSRVVYQYDDLSVSFGAGRLTAVSDGSGITSYNYDAAGRVVSETKALPDLAGPLTQYYGYDLAGRITQITLPDSTRINYSYSPASNPRAVFLNGSPHASYARYSGSGRVGQKVLPHHTTTYEYDPDGYLKTLVTVENAPNPKKLQDYEYHFDDTKNVIGIDDASNAIPAYDWTFDYDAADRLILASPAGLASQTFAYHGRGDLERLGSLSFERVGKEVIAKFVTANPFEVARIRYDSRGRMDRKVSVGIESLFRYDGWDRLVEVDRSGVNVLRSSYDFAGRRIRTEETATNGDVTTVYRLSDSYELRRNSANPSQFTRIRHVSVPGLGRISTIQTDHTGALAVTPRNEEQQPIAAVSSPKFPLDHGNADSARLLPTLAAFLVILLAATFRRGRPWARGLATCLSILLLTTLPAQADVVIPPPPTHGEPIIPIPSSEPPPVIVVPASEGTLSRCATYQDGAWTLFTGTQPGGSSTFPSVPNGALAQATVRYYHGNHIGSAALAVARDGSLSANYVYQAYGEIFPSVSQDDQEMRHRFVQKELDESTGLYFFGARYYDPQFGRFINPDSIIPGGGTTPEDFNRYVYARGNPIRYYDPSGHDFVEATGWFAVGYGQGLSPLPLPGVEPPIAYEQQFYAGQTNGSFTGLLGGLMLEHLGGPALRGLALAGGVPAAGEAANAAATFAGRGIQIVMAPKFVRSLYLLSKANKGSGSSASAKTKAAKDGIVVSNPSVLKAAKEPTKYKRPSGATTPAQRASVQGKPCVDCGVVAPKMNADHKDPLVKQHYEGGGIDKTEMRSVDAVQPQCPTCSNKQGADLSRYSREKAEELGLE